MKKWKMKKWKFWKIFFEKWKNAKNEKMKNENDETGWYMLENDKNLKIGGSSV